ncbi:MAG: hypothetical protein OEW33_00760 [Nitrospirota bacterium]|nr:hypothetical protein [Nitrospirota bacterium]MDH5296151.1 hypothetical protein [Nitrospirota bacterium]
MSAVPPRPPPIIATRLAVIFGFDRPEFLLVMRGGRLEDLGDGIHSHFHDRKQVEDLDELKACPLFIVWCGRNGWTGYRPRTNENGSGRPGVLC